MPYLKTLAKRADEPFRPDRVEAKAPEVAPISPAAPVGPAKAASPSTPKLGGGRSRTGSVAVKAPPGLGQPLRLESNLDALDPKALVTQAAQGGATEVTKAFNLSQLAGVALSREEVADYLKDGRGDAKVRELLAASALAGLDAGKRAQLEAEGRQVKKVRTYDDVATDALASSLKAVYVEQAKDRKEGAAAYKQDIDQVRAILGERQGRDVTPREAEGFLMEEYGRRMRGVGGGTVPNILTMAARQAGGDALRLVDNGILRTAAAATDLQSASGGLSTLLHGIFNKVTGDHQEPPDVTDVRRIGDPHQGPQPGYIEGTMFGADTDRSVRLAKEVAQNIPRQTIENLIAGGYYTPDIKPSFRGLFQAAAPKTPKMPEGNVGGMTFERAQELGEAFGIPAVAVLGIRSAEHAGHGPSAFAFNLHRVYDAVSTTDRARIEAALRAAGVDPSLNAKGLGPLGRQAAKTAYQVVAEIAPVAAVKAGAFGEFQVMGGENEGDFIQLLKSLPALKDATDEEAARMAWQVFQANPELVSTALAANWWENAGANARRLAAEAAESGDGEMLARVYHGNPDKAPERHKMWVANFAAGAAQAKAALAEQPQVDEPAAEPPLSDLRAEAAKERFEAKEQEADVIDEDRSFFSRNILGVVTDWTMPGSRDKMDEDRAKAEGLGQRFVQVGQSAIDFDDIIDSSFMAPAGSARDMLARRAVATLQQTDPEQLARFMEFGQEGMGTGFGKVRDEIYERELRDLMKAARGQTPEEQERLTAEARKRAAAAAANIVTSMQVEGLWTTPVITSMAELAGEADLAGFEFLPDVAREWLGAISPKIELIGRNGDEIIFRQEGGGAAALASLDAMPIIGQAYNAGFAEHYAGPRLKELLGTVPPTSDPLGNGTVFGSERRPAEPASLPTMVMNELGRMNAAGVRGVRERTEMVTLTMGALKSGTAALLDTRLGTAGAEALADTGIVDTGEATGADRTLVIKDRVTAMSMFVGMPIGLVASVLHWDALGGLNSAVRGASAAARAARAMPAAERMLGALTAERHAIAAMSGKRSLATLDVAATLDHLADAESAGDVERASVLLDQVRDIEDALAVADSEDAALRLKSAVAMQEVDALTGARLTAAADAGSAGAKHAIDAKLSANVSSLVGIAIEQGKKAGGERAELAQELEQLVLKNGLGNRLTLSPGRADRAAREEQLASEVFGTADRMRILRLTAQLFDDIEDSREIRLKVMFERMSGALSDFARQSAADWGFGTNGRKLVMFPRADDPSQAGILDVFGPKSVDELTAAMDAANVSDEVRARALKNRDLLEAFNNDLKAAVADGSILDAEVTTGLAARFTASGLDGDAGSLIFRNTTNNITSGRYSHAVAMVLDEAARVTGASPAVTMIHQGMAAVVAFSDARAGGLRDFARLLVDPAAVGGTPEAVDAFLDGGARWSSKSQQAWAMLRAGTREGLSNLIVSSPWVGEKLLRAVDPAAADRLAGTGSALAKRAKLQQMVADGSDPGAVAGAMQHDVLQRLDRRIANIMGTLTDGAAEPAALAKYRAARERVATNEWRASLVAWMAQATDATNRGGVPEPFRDLPIAVDPNVFARGERPYVVTQATQQFLEDSEFFKAYGFAGTRVRSKRRFNAKKRSTKKAMVKEEKQALAVVLDQMVRFMVKVPENASTSEVEAAVRAWYDSNLHGVRRVAGDVTVKKNLAALTEQKRTLINDKVQQLLGSDLDEAYVAAFADPANLQAVDETVEAGTRVVVVGADGAPAGAGFFEVAEAPAGGQVKLKQGETVTEVPLQGVRALTAEAERPLKQALYEAQMVAFDMVVRTMTEAEAILLFGSTKAELAALAADARQAP
ncbi:MAG TPA: hypothetical protein VM031_00005, partial [Phycisphaerae bacterium]|nr:hypothetical protein [Phycisphaerae bacterium]